MWVWPRSCQTILWYGLCTCEYFKISQHNPPNSLSLHNLSQLTQWTFLNSPLYPHQNLQIRTSNSLIKPLGILKQLIVYIGIAWITNLMSTSLPAWDSNLSFQPCDFFQTVLLDKWNFSFSLAPLKLVNPNMFHTALLSGPQVGVEFGIGLIEECLC